MAIGSSFPLANAPGRCSEGASIRGWGRPRTLVRKHAQHGWTGFVIPIIRVPVSPPIDTLTLWLSGDCGGTPLVDEEWFAKPDDETQKGLCEKRLEGRAGSIFQKCSRAPRLHTPNLLIITFRHNLCLYHLAYSDRTVAIIFSFNIHQVNSTESCQFIDDFQTTILSFTIRHRRPTTAKKVPRPMRIISISCTTQD